MGWYQDLSEILDHYDDDRISQIHRTLNLAHPPGRPQNRQQFIDGLLSTVTHNLALREKVLKMVGVRDFESESLLFQQQATAASVEAAKAAQISADEARTANEIAKGAQAKAKGADLKSWLAFGTAIAGLVTAIAKWIAG